MEKLNKKSFSGFTIESYSIWEDCPCVCACSCDTLCDGSVIQAYAGGAGGSTSDNAYAEAKNVPMQAGDGGGMGK